MPLLEYQHGMESGVTSKVVVITRNLFTDEIYLTEFCFIFTRNLFTDKLYLIEKNIIFTRNLFTDQPYLTENTGFLRIRYLKLFSRICKFTEIQLQICLNFTILVKNIYRKSLASMLPENFCNFTLKIFTVHG